MSYTFSDEQDKIFEVALSGRNICIEAGAGCLSGDTVVHINRAAKGSKMKLSHVVQQLHGETYIIRTYLGKEIRQKSRGWDLSIPTKIAIADNGTIRLGTIADAWCSGKKEVYEILTAAGRSIRATATHPFLTESGWQYVSELDFGTIVMVNNKRNDKAAYRKLNYRYTDTKCHPNQTCRSAPRNRYGVPTHRLVVEADLNKYSFKEYIEILRAPKPIDGLVFLEEGQIVHHMDEDHKNNKLENLEILSATEHRKHHGHNGNEKNFLWQVGVDTIVDVKKVGMEMTYDISVVEDPHCFIANDFVVHNSGKTTTVIDMASSLPGKTSYVVFNKAAQEDALKRIKAKGLEDKIIPTTIHALAYRGTPLELRERLYDKTVSRDVQIYRLLKGTKDVHVGQQGSRIRIPKDTLNYLATISFHAFCLSGESNPSRSCIQYLDGIDDIDSTDNNYKLAGYVLPLVRKLWDDCLGEGLVKLNHDTYLKRWSELSPDIDADYITLDESQDSNGPTTKVLLHNYNNHGTQLICVGDGMQQLYSFRNVSDPSPHIPNAVRLTLSQTYRCGPAITSLANKIPHTATSSMVLIGNQEVDAVVNVDYTPRPVDAILCRTNTAVMVAAFEEVGKYVDAGNSGLFPLVCMTDGCKAEAKELIAAYSKASEGKPIAEGSYRGIRNLDGLQAKIGILVIPKTRAVQVHLGETSKEVRLPEQDDDSSTSHLIEVFKLVSEYGVDLAKRVFDARSKKSRVRIMTVHQAKGLEWDSVKIWPDLAPKEEIPGTITDDEKCSLYVAVTRAKNYLDVSSNYYLGSLLGEQ